MYRRAAELDKWERRRRHVLGLPAVDPWRLAGLAELLPAAPYSSLDPAADFGVSGVAYFK